MWQHCIRKKYQKLIVLHTSLAHFTKSKISKKSPPLDHLYGVEEGVGAGGGARVEKEQAEPRVQSSSESCSFDYNRKTFWESSTTLPVRGSDRGDGQEALHHLLGRVVGHWGVHGVDGRPHPVRRFLRVHPPSGRRRHLFVRVVGGGRRLPSDGVVPPQGLVDAVLEGACPQRRGGLVRGRMVDQLLLLLLLTPHLVPPPPLSLLLQVALTLLAAPVPTQLESNHG